MSKLRNELLHCMTIVESSLLDEFFETIMVDAESLRVARDSNCEVCAIIVSPNANCERRSGTIFRSLDQLFNWNE